MHIKALNLDKLIELLKTTKFYCFGCGIQGQRMALFAENWGMPNNLIGYIDNDNKKTGHKVQNDQYIYDIISYDQACEVITEDDLIIISSLHYREISNQIEANEKSREWRYIVLDEVAEEQLMVSDYLNVVRESNEQLIPKKIHYSWLGETMPDKLKKNIDMWKRLCPDYEFYEWNDKNYDIFKNKYMKEAYERKLWGFVPDYMRLDIIYKYGGIYLDTDIEMVRKPDELLYQKCFASVDASLTMNLGSGFGAIPSCGVIRELRDYYNDRSFINKDGTIDKTSCNTHSYRVLKKYGVKICDSIQCVNEMNIYPMIFQGACQHTRKKRITEKTFWVHYGNMSWM